MRSRITLAILGTVVSALLLTGIGTLLLDRVTARSEVERDLSSQAQGLAALMAPNVGSGEILRRPAISKIIRGFKLQGVSFLFIAPGGRIVGTPPPGIDPDLIDPVSLNAGETLSGRQGRVVYAIAPARARTGTVVAALTREVDLTPGSSFRWFAISATFTLMLGGVVALALSRALTKPLRRAEHATERIAAGEFHTRLADPPANAHDELSDLARAINTMAQRLDRSRGLEQQFLLSVSHDLRTPLTSIRGFAEAIADGTASDPTTAATVILGESRRLERLVRDLLDLARLDARQFKLNLRSLAVTEIVTDSAEGFRRAADEAGIALIIDEDPERGTAAVDPDRLAQVVANLVENGLKFAERQLRVSTFVEGDTMGTTVTDDGVGIAPVDLPHVFERLYVAHHQPSRSESGSGLGLAIARDLIQAMGGTIAAESPIGAEGGTRIVVRLPRISAGQAPPQQ